MVPLSVSAAASGNIPLQGKPSRANRCRFRLAAKMIFGASALDNKVHELAGDIDLLDDGFAV